MIVSGDQGTKDNWETDFDLGGLDLTASSPRVVVGSGLVGCIREGPGVRFTKNGTAVTSNDVKWGPGDNCLLPEKCSGGTITETFTD